MQLLRVKVLYAGQCRALIFFVVKEQAQASLQNQIKIVATVTVSYIEAQAMHAHEILPSQLRFSSPSMYVPILELQVTPIKVVQSQYYWDFS